jgi:hypothetical protein
MATADMMTQLATLVQGGMPPEQAIQYLRDAQAQQFAKMPVKEQLASNIGMYAGRVGQGLLRAAGVEDPMLAQASKMRDLATQFDTSTADGMMQYAKALQSVNPALAQQAAMKAREMAVEESKLTTEKARQGQIAAQEKRALAEVAEKKSKETAAEAAARSRAKALLKKFPEMSEEEASALSDDPKVVTDLLKVPKKEAIKTDVITANGRKLLINKDTGETIKDLGVAGKTLEESLGAGLSVIGNAIAKKQAEATGAEGGKAVGKDIAQIQGKEDALTAVRSALDLVKSGIYSGGYGPMQEAVAKYTPIGSKARLQNTEQFRASIGEVVIPRLQEFGGNDSNEELKYLRSIVGGETTFERATLQRVLESAERKIQRGIERVQKQQAAVEQGKPLPTSVSGARTVNWADLPKGTQ